MFQWLLFDPFTLDSEIRSTDSYGYGQFVDKADNFHSIMKMQGFSHINKIDYGVLSQ